MTSMIHYILIRQKYYDMANLTPTEKQCFEELFDMSFGYILEM